jgi:aspartate kinase
MVSTSEVAVSVTIDDSRFLAEIERELKVFGAIEVESNQSIVCIVGNMLSEKEGVLKQVFESLQRVPVSMVSYGASPNNISVLVPTAEKEKTLQALNKGLFGLD